MNCWLVEYTDINSNKTGGIELRPQNDYDNPEGTKYPVLKNKGEVKQLISKLINCLESSWVKESEE